MKARIVVEMDNGLLSVTGNVGDTELVGLLEAAKFSRLANATGLKSAAPPMTDAGSPAPSGTARTWGLLNARRVDA